MNLPPDHVPAWVDKARLAAEISGSLDTVDEWVRKGLLPAGLKRGGKTLWEWKTVRGWIARGGPEEAGLTLDAERIRKATADRLSRRGRP